MATVAPAEVMRRIRVAGGLGIIGKYIGVIAATKAYHPGSETDISRKAPAIAMVEAENEEFYTGKFLEGFGLLHVQFPKSGCRELTEEEVKRLLQTEATVGPFPSGESIIALER